MSDAEITKTEAEEAARQVLLPQPKLHVFLGIRLQLKPLPIAIAKRLRILSSSVETKIEKLEINDEHTKQVNELDLLAADTYAQAAEILLRYYGTEMTSDQIGDKASLAELKDLIMEQLNVQGSEDFLLQPLKRIIEMFSAKQQRKANPVTTS